MPFYSTTTAAEILGVSSARVLIFIRDGRLPAEKVGRTWIISPDDLEEFRKKPRPQGWKPGRPRKAKAG
jgi:excisionase family DNA binding protein